MNLKLNLKCLYEDFKEDPLGWIIFIVFMILFQLFAFFILLPLGV